MNDFNTWNFENGLNKLNNLVSSKIFLVSTLIALRFYQVGTR